ncbi:MAG: hypothetical protein KAT34_10600 [Candidatus Aminicenantes bacterium]|nr:hypothetical protein [Candidatus Aminicenantes bacterium]
MTAPTKQIMLDNVETAINAIAAGGAVQSYNISGRNIQKYSLTELINLRTQLKKEINAESSTGTTNYAGFDR